MNNKERKKEIEKLYAAGFGRPTIVEKVEGVTEWQVRKTISDLQRGNTGADEEVVRAAKARKKKSTLEIITGLSPMRVTLPVNKRVKTVNHNIPVVAFVSDTHGQFVDEKALDVACQIIEDLSPDILVHLGDLGDFYSISSHSKNPARRENLQDDLEASSRILGKLTQTVSPKTKKILVEGNHEDRLKRYIWHNAPALAGLPELEISNLIGAKDMGWEYIKQDKELFPDFLIKHGDFVSSKASYTARKEMDRAWMSGISGHTHRHSVYQYTPRSKSLREKRPALWIENGMLCETDAEYLRSPGDWQQGFTIMRFDKDGPIPEMVSILNGRAYHNGRIYKA